MMQKLDRSKAHNIHRAFSARGELSNAGTAPFVFCRKAKNSEINPEGFVKYTMYVKYSYGM